MSNSAKIVETNLDVDPGICPICFVNKADYTTYCKHEFCSICINKLRNKICPICRQNIVAGPKNQIYLSGKDFGIFREIQRSNILCIYEQIRIHN